MTKPVYKNGIRMIRTRNTLLFVHCVNGKRSLYLNGHQIPRYVTKENYLLEAFDTAMPLNCDFAPALTYKESRLLDLNVGRTLDVGASTFSLNAGTINLDSGDTLWYCFYDLVLVTKSHSGQVSVNGFDIPRNVIENSEFEQRRATSQDNAEVFIDYVAELTAQVLRDSVSSDVPFIASTRIYE